MKIHNDDDFRNLIDEVKKYQVGKDREDICSKLFLIGLYLRGEIRFPIEVLKRESPDYKITIQVESIGLEHTRATHEQYKHLGAIVRKRGKREMFEVDVFRPGITVPQDQLETKIVDEKVGIKGRGYFGDEPEIDFSQFVIKAIEEKTKKLGSGGYQIFGKNILMIEDDNPFQGKLKRDVVIKEIEEYNYWNKPSKIKFDQIIVFLGNDLIYIDPTGTSITDVSKGKL